MNLRPDPANWKVLPSLPTWMNSSDRMAFTRKEPAPWACTQVSTQSRASVMPLRLGFITQSGDLVWASSRTFYSTRSVEFNAKSKVAKALELRNGSGILYRGCSWLNFGSVLGSKIRDWVATQLHFANFFTNKLIRGFHFNFLIYP